MKRPAHTYALFVITVCLSVALSPLAQAGMISTHEVLAEQTGQTNRDTVNTFLDRATVQETLEAMDVSADLAHQRVNALTPAETASLAQRIDALPAAGALSGNDVVVILLVAILVVLIL